MKYNLPLLQISGILLLMLICGCREQPTPSSTTAGTESSKSIRSDTVSSGRVPLPEEPLMVGPLQVSTETVSGRFIETSPEDSGVDFANRWPDRFDEELPGSFITAGVAVGDFDGDGKPDFFAARRSDGGRLYKNVGSFKFEDVTEKWKLNLEGIWGTGATFADVNNDGKLDLCVCGFDSPNRLFINKGDHFVDQAKSLGLSYSGPSVVMTFADYDRDGDLDAYLLTNHTHKDPRPEVPIQRDDLGKPYIPEKYGESFYYIIHPSGKIVKEWAGRYDHLYRNDGDKFVNISEEAGVGRRAYYGLSATWWDYNDDGWPDLYVSNDFKGPDHLYRNDGPNRFGDIKFTDTARTALPHTPWFSMGSDIADINNDGRMDLLASDMAGTNHYRDKLSMGPMSGPDSRAWFLNVPNPPQYMRNCAYLNTGTDRFMEAAYLTGLANTDWTWTVRFSDFDQDGFSDVFFTNGMSRDWFNGDRIEKAKQFYNNAGGGARGSTLGYEYWFLTPPYKLENLAFRNKGDLKFESVGQEWGLDHFGVSTGSATGDFDLDGDLDLIVNGFNERLRIYQNAVSSGNCIKVYLHGRTSNRQALGAKIVAQSIDSKGKSIRQMRYLNSNQGIMSSSESVAHFGLGDADQLERLEITWPSGIVQEFVDVAANQSLQVTEPRHESQLALNDANPPRPQTLFTPHAAMPKGFSHVEIPFDDYRHQPLLPNKYSQLGPGMAWADIDADGDYDCFFGAAGGSISRIMRNDNGTLAFDRQESFIADRAYEDMGSLFFDADGDQDLDLYVVSGGGEAGADPMMWQDRLYLNDGEGKFAAATEQWLPKITTSGSCVAGADFDRDGDIDLFVGGRIVPGAYPTPPQSLLLVNSGARFVDEADALAVGLSEAGMVTSAIWADVNNDDWTDLLVTYEWGPVRLFMNREGVLKEATNDSGLADNPGWYNSISSGDIDNDGDIDFVIGNFGLNTKYYASDAKPELLFYGEFDDSGIRHIIEAKFENEVCLPRRGLGCSSHAMPTIKDKLPTFHDFAMSPLDQVYSDSAIEQSMRFEINNLESIALVNESEGDDVAFKTVQLPRLAQVSPIFGSQLVDLDGDRLLDLVVAQNFYGPQRETGYMDGGVSLMLKGHGDGQFSAVWPSQSGIVVKGDAMSLAVVDLDQDRHPDLAIGRNDASPLTFRNRTKTNGNVVRLVGPSYNRNALGCRLFIEWSDGRQVFDLAGGSGYLSQMPNEMYLGTATDIKEITVVWSDGKRERYKKPEFTDNILEIKYVAPAR